MMVTCAVSGAPIVFAALATSSDSFTTRRTSRRRRHSSSRASSRKPSALDGERGQMHRVLSNSWQVAPYLVGGHGQHWRQQARQAISDVIKRRLHRSTLV